MPLSREAEKLVAVVGPDNTFEDNASALAGFFRSGESNVDPGRLLAELHDSTGVKAAWYERFLFSLLHIGISDIDVAREVIGFRRLKRLVMRCKSGAGTVSDTERALSKRLAEAIPGITAERLGRLAADAEVWITQVFDGHDLRADDRTTLITLIRLEADALQECIGSLSATVDPYDMRTMARVLPRLSIYDERVKAYRDFADALEQRSQIGSKVLYFEYRMGPDAFVKWNKKVAHQKRLGHLRDVLALQRRRMLPTLSLIAVSSLHRWIGGEAGDTPLSWIEQALNSCTGGRFRVDAGERIGEIASMVTGAGAEIDGSFVCGDFSERTYSQWIGPDLLTIPLAREPEPMSIRTLVASCMNREVLLSRLLENPKVYGTPALVERIVRRSRSVRIITEIARTPALHRGAANANVPAALLRSPVNVPIELIRRFVSTRYVNLTELRKLSRIPSELRPAVASEISSYLERRG